MSERGNGNAELQRIDFRELGAFAQEYGRQVVELPRTPLRTDVR